MKIPLSWLKDYVDITLDLEQLAKTLTMAGLEVDGDPAGGFAQARRREARIQVFTGSPGIARRSWWQRSPKCCRIPMQTGWSYANSKMASRNIWC